MPEQRERFLHLQQTLRALHEQLFRLKQATRALHLSPAGTPTDPHAATLEKASLMQLRLHLEAESERAAQQLGVSGAVQGIPEQRRELKLTPGS
jgi:hypothetical protein